MWHYSYIIFQEREFRVAFGCEDIGITDLKMMGSCGEVQGLCGSREGILFSFQAGAYQVVVCRLRRSDG